MKNIINNANKLASLALAMFLAAGVVSCGCGDDPNKKPAEVKVKLTINTDNITKNLAPATGNSTIKLEESDITRIVTVTVEEGEITEELAKKITLSGEFGNTDKKNETLEKAGIKSLGKGKSGTITLKWFGGENDLAALNAKVQTGAQETTKSINPSQGDNRKKLNGKKTFDLYGSGVTVSQKAEMTVTLTPVTP